MTPLEALWLGIVQGLTEFLPVSSSGHLVMAQALLGLEQPGLVFEVAVHVATLLSVLVVYRKRIGELVLGALRRDAQALAYGAKLVLATLPAVALVLVAGDWLEGLFERPAVAGLALIGTGCILATTRYTMAAARLPEPGWGTALGIGCAQALAIVPGISRSGSTVAAAMAMGVAPTAAAEFSFLMSVPAILGAAVRSLGELSAVEAGVALPLALGAGAAAVSGVGAILLFVRLLRSRAFHRFAYYTWAVGAAFLAWLWLA